MWLALLAFHLVGLVGFNLTLRKFAVGRVDKFLLATIAQTGIAIIAVFLLIFRPPNLSLFSVSDFLYVVAAVLLTIGLQISNVKALQYLEASVFSVVYNLRIILTTIIGILFLNEGTHWLRIAGGLFILLGIFIVRQRGSQTVRTRGVEWAVTAALCISFLNLCEKTLIGHVGLLGYFPMVSVVCAIVMWGYLLATQPKPKLGEVLSGKTMQLMTLRAISAYGFSGALAAGALVSVANYISSLSVIFMVLLGAIWLGERDYMRRKIMATAVAVAGLTLILASRI